MKFEIKSRWSQSVLFAIETDTIKLAVEAALKAGANLADANLTDANLTYANLTDANLTDANLTGAKLTYANLTYANLTYANLTYANLTDANLTGAKLTGAKLTYANLTDANLTYANLTDANLTGAKLTGAKLTDANLTDAKNADLAFAKTTILPEGNLVGWKKCEDNVIVKLLIPQKAKRSCASGRKCRAEYVEVLRVYGAEQGISQHDQKTVYRKGETVRCDKWDEDRWQECSGGIHFFITRIEAENF